MARDHSGGHRISGVGVSMARALFFPPLILSFVGIKTPDSTLRNAENTGAESKGDGGVDAPSRLLDPVIVRGQFLPRYLPSHCDFTEIRYLLFLCLYLPGHCRGKPTLPLQPAFPLANPPPGDSYSPPWTTGDQESCWILIFIPAGPGERSRARDFVRQSLEYGGFNVEVRIFGVARKREGEGSPAVWRRKKS